MRISVLTPSYNSGPYIEKAIMSVLHQNYSDVEHIIMDGGSTDTTIAILKKYPHLKWLSEKDNGQSDAMNKAFKMSTGEIIVYLNADDYFEPNVFKTVVDYFIKHTTNDVLVGRLNNAHFADDFKPYISIPEIEFKKIILPFKYQFPYNPVSYFYKRQVQEVVGEFPTDNHLAMDYWFIVRAFAKFKVGQIDTVLGTFFRTGLNKTSLSTNSQCNSIAFDYCKTKGAKWQFYFIVNYIIHKIKYTPRSIFKSIKYVFYLIFLSYKVSSETYHKIGFKKAFKVVFNKSSVQ